MGRWYRVLVVTMAVAAILFTAAAAYAGAKLIDAERRLLSNQMLIRTVEEWWED